MNVILRFVAGCLGLVSVRFGVFRFPEYSPLGPALRQVFSSRNAIDISWEHLKRSGVWPIESSLDFPGCFSRFPEFVQPSPT